MFMVARLTEAAAAMVAIRAAVSTSENRTRREISDNKGYQRHGDAGREDDVGKLAFIGPEMVHQAANDEGGEQPRPSSDERVQAEKKAPPGRAGRTDAIAPSELRPSDLSWCSSVTELSQIITDAMNPQ